MHPLHVRKEIEAFVADRLLEAVWREALWLVKDGIATTARDRRRHPLRLRPALGQMGIFETYRIAGGEAGMRHFMAQFGPCLKWPWTKLTDVPEFTTSWSTSSPASPTPSPAIIRSASWSASATTTSSPSCRR
jgi:carnitine 3-dehydrogenase